MSTGLTRYITPTEVTATMPELEAVQEIQVVSSIDWEEEEEVVLVEMDPIIIIILTII